MCGKHTAGNDVRRLVAACQPTRAQSEQVLSVEAFVPAVRTYIQAEHQRTRSLLYASSVAEHPARTRYSLMSASTTSLCAGGAPDMPCAQRNTVVCSARGGGLDKGQPLLARSGCPGHGLAQCACSWAPRKRYCCRILRCINLQAPSQRCLRWGRSLRSGLAVSIRRHAHRNRAALPFGGRCWGVKSAFGGAAGVLVLGVEHACPQTPPVPHSAPLPTLAP